MTEFQQFLPQLGQILILRMLAGEDDGGRSGRGAPKTYSTDTCAFPSGRRPLILPIVRAQVSRAVRRWASTTGSGRRFSVSLQA